MHRESRIKEEKLFKMKRKREKGVPRQSTQDTKNTLYVVGIRTEQDANAIHKPTDSEKSNGQQIDNAHADFSFVELMCAELPKEQAKQKCNPFVLGMTIAVDVFVDICVGVVDDDIRLSRCCLFDGLYLTAAEGTNNSGYIDFLTTVFAELRRC